MVTVDKAIIAKVEKKGKHFEVLVDPELAYDLRSGKQISVSSMLAVNEVFKDSRKGLKIGPGDLEESFGSQDVFSVAEKIVKEGEIQLTTEFRKKKEIEKKRQIAAFISKNAMDPRTKMPHPIERIMTAMDQAGIHVDASQPADRQIEKVVDAIKGIIPISMEKVSLQVHVPAKYSNQAYGIIKSFGSPGKWLGDGSLQAVIIIPAGLKDEIFSRLNKATNGEVSIQER